MSASASTTATLMAFPPKDPLDVLDYSMDFSLQMAADSDNLAAIVAITSTPPGLIATNPTLTDNTATGFISGGIPGVTYVLDFEVTTVGGRTYNRGGTLLVTPR